MKDPKKQSERDHIFPPPEKTAREMAVAMASGGPPDTDWRPALSQRFGLDGNLSPHELDGANPGEPDRYDIADIHEAHALAHVPLWRIDASQVKLLLDYGFASTSVFFLAQLMLEDDPFQFVEGSVFGELLPSYVKAARQQDGTDYPVGGVDKVLETAERVVDDRSRDNPDPELEADRLTLEHARSIYAQRSA